MAGSTASTLKTDVKALEDLDVAPIKTAHHNTGADERGVEPKTEFNQDGEGDEKKE